MMTTETAEKLMADYRATQNDVCSWARTVRNYRLKGQRELEEQAFQKLMEATERNDAALSRMTEAR